MTTRKDLNLQIQLIHEHSYNTAERVYQSANGEQVVIGYLCLDPPDENNCVFDGDSMGRIVLKNGDENMWAYLGREDHATPDIEPYIDVVMRLCGIEGELDDQDDSTRDRVASAATALWHEADGRGLVGTKYAVGLCRTNNSVYREDNPRHINEVWVPDKYWLEMIEDHPEAEREAVWNRDVSGILEEYDAWARGDVWGVCTETYTRLTDGSFEQVEEEACWGYVGQKYAETELESNFQSSIESISSQCELALA